MKLKSTIIYVILIGFSTHFTFAQLTENRESDPYKAKFVYQDLENFVNVYNSLTKESDTIVVIQKKYLDQGTVGLKEFIKKYHLTAERLVRSMHKYPSSYTDIHIKLKALKEQEQSYKKAYAKLKEYLPSAEFPPTYFLVGSRRGIGSGSKVGPLLTIEKHIGITDFAPGEVFTGTMVHEMTHMQQLRVLKEEYYTIFNENNTLLSRTISEGVAEFFGLLVNNGVAYKAQFMPYVDQHEKKLWDQFKIDAASNNFKGCFDNWLWNKPKDPNQPRDLGYLIGFKMAEAYFNNSTDKQKASEYLIAITDYEKFFRECGYNP